MPDWFARARWTGMLVVAAAACSEGDPGPTPPPPPPVTGELTLANVGTFSFPVFLVSPPGDANRLFIVEKRGLIRIVKQGTTLATAFLDLSTKVTTGSEQGLLGLAFHPQFGSNGLVVVNYTNLQGDTRISSFRVSGGNPDVADPASEQVLLPVAQPFPNHNGGMVAFGPDGMLYLGLGDGGSAGDPQGNGQSRATLLGKILRVSLSSAGQLSIPADNPFVGQAGFRGEIWSYGLRNPWRFSFDRSNGDLYIGDVGQGAREEIDVAASAQQFGRGVNYGWSVMEGRSCYPPGDSCNQQGLALPVLDYNHSNNACSVTGGYVYRGSITSIRGTYFYADYCAGWVRSFRLAGGAVTEAREWTSLAPGGQITSFGEDTAGELYILTAGGRVAKIVAQP